MSERQVHEDARAERAILSHAEAYRLVDEARGQRERAEVAEAGVARLTAERDGLSLALSECREAGSTVTRGSTDGYDIIGQLYIETDGDDRMADLARILAQPPDAHGAALLARLQAAEAVCAALGAVEHGTACQECGECAGCGHELDCSLGAAMAAYRQATATPSGGQNPR